ncbi:MAG: glycosyltransferase family 2 protein [Candidatus Omnitrophota bacterium]
MMEDKVPISVVVIVKNEEKRIAECLESVKWADEIVVLDDMSEDKTVEIAKRYTDKVHQRKMDIEGRHRNYAYSLAKNKWVLSLDADERATPQLKDEIEGVVRTKDEYYGFSIPIRNYIGDYWIKHGGWYPSPQVRLFKKDHFRYEEAEVHPRIIMPDPRGFLKSDIIHYNYKDFHDAVRKLNKQTTLEATKWIRDKRKMTLFKALWRTVDRFIRRYFGKKGYRDGVIGLALAVFSGFYQFLTYAKYWELKQRCTRN